MTENICFRSESASRASDLAISIVAYVGVFLGAVATAGNLSIPRRRQFPARIVIYLGVVSSCIGLSFAVGGFIHYRHTSGSDHQEFCVLQGVALQFFLVSMLLLLLFYQAAQYCLFVKHVNPTSMRKFEGPVLVSIFLFAAICTVLPASMGEIGAVKHFYACWLKNGTSKMAFFFWLCCGALGCSLFLCIRSLGWFNEIASSDIGRTRPEAQKVLYRVFWNNTALLLGLAVFSAIILASYIFPDRDHVLCFLVSLDLALLPYVYLVAFFGFYLVEFLLQKTQSNEDEDDENESPYPRGPLLSSDHSFQHSQSQSNGSWTENELTDEESLKYHASPVRGLGAPLLASENYLSTWHGEDWRVSAGLEPASDAPAPPPLPAPSSSPSPSRERNTQPSSQPFDSENEASTLPQATSGVFTASHPAAAPLPPSPSESPDFVPQSL